MFRSFLSLGRYCCITLFSSLRYVHGDLRDTNIMVKRYFKLVGFNWSGRISEIRHPMNEESVSVDHDIQILNYMRLHPHSFWIRDIWSMYSFLLNVVEISAVNRVAQHMESYRRVVSITPHHKEHHILYSLRRVQYHAWQGKYIGPQAAESGHEVLWPQIKSHTGNGRGPVTGTGSNLCGS